MVDTFARGAAQYPKLTVLVLFLGLLMTIGTAAMFAIFAYQLSGAGENSNESDAPVISEQGN